MAVLAETSVQIERLKSVADCKIIKNVGDFAYLINATIPATNVSIKFQLSADYPKVPATIFLRHPTMSKDEIQRITAAVSSDITSLVDTFTAVKERIDPYQPINETEQKDASPNSTRRQKQNKDRETEDGKVSTKKPSMRTAADVIKRVQWDASLQSENFVVGYIDRFLGIQEQPFSAFNWVNPAEADWMDLNIPEHRIEYFKYDDKIVWEKKSRIDNVFGSTGGMTIDQLLSVDQPSSDIEQAAAATAAATIAVDSDLENLNSKSVENSGKDAFQTSSDTISTPKPQTSYNRPSTGRPNHFIAIPVTDSVVVEAVRALQDEYVTLSESDGEQFMTELNNLHITLCAVSINNQTQMDELTQLLYELILDEESKLQQEFSFNKLDRFWSRILYASPTLNEDFQNFVLNLRKLIRSKGIQIYDDVDQFVPHLTILKFPRNEEIYFPVEDFIRIKSETLANGNIIGKALSLEQICLYSMERDSNNHYVEKLALSI